MGGCSVESDGSDPVAVLGRNVVCVSFVLRWEGSGRQAGGR